MTAGRSTAAILKATAIRSLARITRHFHPRGTVRVLSWVHGPEGRDWSIEAVAPLSSAPGFKLHVNTTDHIEWYVFFCGAYEPETSRMLRHYLRPGDTAVDIGANVGVHTLAMAQAVEYGRVIACEPNPVAFARLQANLLLNSIATVEVRPVALADRAGELLLHTSSRGPGANSSASLGARAGSDGSCTVPVVTLDSLLDDLEVSNLAVVKIDVEGFDGAVLAGAGGTLARFHPVLVFEYSPELWLLAGYAIDQVLQYLRDAGYDEFHTLTPRGLQALDHSPTATTMILAR